MADSEEEEGNGLFPLTNGSDDEEVREACLTRFSAKPKHALLQRGDVSFTLGKAQSPRLQNVTVKTEE